MQPPRSSTKEFEKVSTDDFLTATIEEIQHDENHTFKGYQGAPDKVRHGVRFKFSVDGYKFPHYSKWLTFSYHEKANLFKTYIAQLVDKAYPEMEFDIERLKGMKVKTLWNEYNGFQNIDKIRPLDKKLPKDATVDMGDLSPDEDCPF